jgi:hypothetical protein
MNLQEVKRFQNIAGLLKEEEAIEGSPNWSRTDTDALEQMLQKYSDYLNSSETKSEYDQYSSLLKKHTRFVDEVLSGVKHGWM